MSRVQSRHTSLMVQFLKLNWARFVIISRSAGREVSVRPFRAEGRLATSGSRKQRKAPACIFTLIASVKRRLTGKVGVLRGFGRLGWGCLKTKDGQICFLDFLQEANWT